MSAIFILGYCVGNIVGPRIFRAKDAPRYVSAEITIIVLFAACMVDMMLTLCIPVMAEHAKSETEAERWICKAGGN